MIVVQTYSDILYELIDTLWNVNKTVCPSGLLFFHELIDTLWNVNSDFKYSASDSIGINRYIMECK